MGLSAIKILIAVIFVVVTVNLYFLSIILTQTSGKHTVAVKELKKQYKYVNSEKKYDKRKTIHAKVNNVEPIIEVNTTFLATQKILATVKNINHFYKSLSGYKNTRTQFKNILNDFTKSLSIFTSSESFWNTASKWVSSRQILPQHGTQMLSNILDRLSSSKIIKAENTSKGTQLKILLTLEGGQKALFKPQWYD